MDHLKIAQLCIDAYSDDPDIHDENDVVRAIIRRVDGHLLCVFAGTDPSQIHDLITDGDAIPRQIPEIGWGHGGIFSATIDSADRMDHVIGDEPVWLAGHSLGGGIAEAYAYHRAVSGKPISGLTTFGKPMIIIGRHAAQLIGNVPVTLFRHAGDIIPLLPIRVPLLVEYQHPCALTQLGKDGGGLDFTDIRGSIERELDAHSMEATKAALTLYNRGQLATD